MIEAKLLHGGQNTKIYIQFQLNKYLLRLKMKYKIFPYFKVIKEKKYDILYCSDHGILSEREAEEAPETFTGPSLENEDGWSEPFRCPIFDNFCSSDERQCLKPLERKILIEIK